MPAEFSGSVSVPCFAWKTIVADAVVNGSELSPPNCSEMMFVAFSDGIPGSEKLSTVGLLRKAAPAPIPTSSSSHTAMTLKRLR
ncbi:hypothetical protein MTP03_45520 [Tsukamurella sp. PLM1]|nr:hypothetical protein MTP03_45520 [Tsukamurella sp. PLM1]